jgi:hypothetical protein
MCRHLRARIFLLNGVGAGPVLIHRFLNGEAFDPDTVENMSSALASACKELGLRETDDAANRLLAMRIIDMASAGVRNTALLRAAALRGLKRPCAFG